MNEPREMLLQYLQELEEREEREQYLEHQHWDEYIYQMSMRSYPWNPKPITCKQDCPNYIRQRDELQKKATTHDFLRNKYTIKYPY
jgi:hypothetical protein